MMNSMLVLLAAGMGQAAVTIPSPPPVIFRPPPANEVWPPAPDGRVPAVRATAIDSLPALFSTADYPLEAIRAGQTGTVSYSIDIGRNGRVTRCMILKSSGAASLDATTCSILSRRARFTPARDAANQVVEDRSYGKIRWTLPPQIPMPYADRKASMILSADASGEVTRCRIEDRGRSIPASACEPIVDLFTALGANAGSILTPGGELVQEHGLLIGDPNRVTHIGRGEGEVRRKFAAVAIEIDPSGRVVHCATLADEPGGARKGDRCLDTLKGRFAPLDAAAERVERRAVRYWTVYTRPAR